MKALRTRDALAAVKREAAKLGCVESVRLDADPGETPVAVVTLKADAPGARERGRYVAVALKGQTEADIREGLRAAILEPDDAWSPERFGHGRVVL